MENNFIYASYTRRFFSNIIDEAILLTLIILIPMKYNVNISTFIYNSYITIFVYIIVYHIIFISSGWQATPGKKLVGIKVINKEGYKLPFGLSVLRHTLALSFYIVAIIICGYIMDHSIQSFGYLLILLGVPLLFVVALFFMYFCFRRFNKKRTFYDIVSRSHVVVV